MSEEYDPQLDVVIEEEDPDIIEAEKQEEVNEAQTSATKSEIKKIKEEKRLEQLKNADKDIEDFFKEEGLQVSVRRIYPRYLDGEPLISTPYKWPTPLQMDIEQIKDMIADEHGGKTFQVEVKLGGRHVRSETIQIDDTPPKNPNAKNKHKGNGKVEDEDPVKAAQDRLEIKKIEKESSRLDKQGAESDEMKSIKELLVGMGKGAVDESEMFRLREEIRDYKTKVSTLEATVLSQKEKINENKEEYRRMEDKLQREKDKAELEQRLSKHENKDGGEDSLTAILLQNMQNASIASEDRSHRLLETVMQAKGDSGTLLEQVQILKTMSETFGIGGAAGGDDGGIVGSILKIAPAILEKIGTAKASGGITPEMADAFIKQVVDDLRPEIRNAVASKTQPQPQIQSSAPMAEESPAPVQESPAEAHEKAIHEAKALRVNTTIEQVIQDLELMPNEPMWPHFAQANLPNEVLMEIVNAKKDIELKEAMDKYADSEILIRFYNLVQDDEEKRKYFLKGFNMLIELVNQEGSDLEPGELE